MDPRRGPLKFLEMINQIKLMGKYDLYEEDYFYGRGKFGYFGYRHRLKGAIQRHYLNILKWANRRSPWNVLEGNGKSALDIGCAYGFVVELLRKLGYDAKGIDLSRHAVRNHKGLMSDLDLIIGDAQELPFRRESFDLITCFETLEHLPNLRKDKG
ncbi:MAG: class I SAM-dependent methyltransferase, partial [Candidatus Bathyarchaeia archaeon]